MSVSGMERLSEVYELEQQADRATLKCSFSTAASRHRQAIEIIDKAVQTIEQQQSSDEYGAGSALRVLRNEIATRIKELEQYKDGTVPAPGKKVVPTVEGAVANASGSSGQLSDVLLTINAALIKDLGIDALKKDVDKVRFIDNEKIAALEHRLQLLSFKEMSSKSAPGAEDLRIKNKLLAELNAVYYTELMANRELVKKIVSTVHDVGQGLGATVSTGAVDDDSQSTIRELQKKVASLERDKIQLEDQIVMSKERWNNLVESARKRKERRASMN